VTKRDEKSNELKQEKRIKEKKWDEIKEKK
jgi:hypothetical protein